MNIQFNCISFIPVSMQRNKKSKTRKQQKQSDPDQYQPLNGLLLILHLIRLYFSLSLYLFFESLPCLSEIVSF